VRNFSAVFFVCFLFMLFGDSAASGFIPMTPVGADCIPVSVEFTGSREAEEQLEFDIDFSGILETASADRAYAHVKAVLSGTRGEFTLSVSVDGAEGDMLLKKEYSGNAWEALVHRFADELVYLLSGETGIASTRVAFITRTGGNYTLSASSIDSRPSQTIISDSEVITTPAWSPDGSKIAFTSYRHGTGDMYLYTFSNSSANRIITGGVNTAPAWAPGSRYLAFTRSIDGNSDIYRYDTATGDARRLTVRGSIETSASYSPTGQQIIFTSDRVGYPQLYIMDASGGTAERAGFAHGYCDSPSWSPSGDRIAYCARAGSGFHIFVMNSDGTDIRQVTSDGSLNEDPVWSPTGRHLAFSSDRDGTRSIYLLELNKLTMYRLTSGGESYCPTWSPIPEQGGIL
jgi:TolB protein